MLLQTYLQTILSNAWKSKELKNVSMNLQPQDHVHLILPNQRDPALLKHMLGIAWVLLDISQGRLDNALVEQHLAVLEERIVVLTS